MTTTAPATWKLFGGGKQMEQIKVLVVEADLENRSMIIDFLSDVEYIQLAGEVGSAEEALEIVEGANPDVILIGALIPGEGYKLAEEISASYPWIAMIMVEEELKEEMMRKAIFVGAKDVLLYPFTPAKLVDSIYNSYRLEKKKQDIQQDKTYVLRKKNQQGKIITVFSTKGGVGKTFISTNLAVSLAQHTKEKVVLVDLDLDFGNVALALNLVPRYTIADVINEIRNLDQELMEGYLVPHRSGIKVLAANAQPQTTDFVNAEHIEFMIKVLQSTFDYLVIDMPARFHEPVDPVFQLTDLLLLVTTQEVSTIRNIKASLAALNSWSYPQHKIKLVLNKAESHSDIKIKDVETTLDRSLFGMVPAEYKPVSSSLNKGIPAVLLYPRAKVSRGIQKLTHGILGNGQEKKKTGFLKAKK